MGIKDAKVGTIPEDHILLPGIVHACVVVRDVEKTAGNLAKRFGIGPWEVRLKHLTRISLPICTRLN